MPASLSRRLLIATTTSALLVGCQPSEPVRDSTPATPSYQLLGPAPALKPELSQAALPDFGQIRDVATKKAAFFDFLRPLVEQQNQHMTALRGHILLLEKGLRDKGGLHLEDRRWLDEAAKLFRVDSDDSNTQISRLKRKVGEIPTAMVLAQAANESAWGTSRFARQGNNLFGMWCFRPGCGIAPLQRAAGATHQVAAYASVEEGIYRYLINLNANPSYRDMRTIRQCLREQQKPLSGRALAAGLTSYSERGSHYVKELRAMIRINRLEPWATSWWGEQAPQTPCYEMVQVTIDAPDPIVQQAASTAPASSAAMAATATATASADGSVSDTLARASSTSTATVSSDSAAVSSAVAAQENSASAAVKTVEAVKAELPAAPTVEAEDASVLAE